MILALGQALLPKDSRNHCMPINAAITVITVIVCSGSSGCNGSEAKVRYIHSSILF